MWFWALIIWPQLSQGWFHLYLHCLHPWQSHQAEELDWKVWSTLVCPWPWPAQELTCKWVTGGDASSSILFLSNPFLGELLQPCPESPGPAGFNFLLGKVEGIFLTGAPVTFSTLLYFEVNVKFRVS